MKHAALLLPFLALAPSPAGADCHVVDVAFQPATSDLQIVAWVESSTGAYEGTVYITQATGRFGLGNRPGRFDFNSGPIPPHPDEWPYGRRVTIFPVWAARHGLQFPKVVFQNNDEDNLSHPFNQSSPEHHFCRPQTTTDPGWDADTCASTVYTDKGVFSMTDTTGYPPRADVSRNAGTDSNSVDLYKMLNPFDAVSAATPMAGVLAQVHWRVPADLPRGDHVLFVEVSREFDFNTAYNDMTLPPPMNIPFKDYGAPYRGQPSVVYKVPFTIVPSESMASTLDYVGYGDVDGATGTLHPPDATITTDTPGSGASRLEIVADGGGTYRVKVDSRPENDTIAPGNATDLTATTIAATTAHIQFVAPGDDGQTGQVAGYDVRIRAGEPITADNFDSSTPITSAVVPVSAGNLQSADLTGLLPETEYWIGVRAYDKCHNTSDVAVASFTTAAQPIGEVNACFVATAAYGSLLANDVTMLRRFRDVFLETTPLGELATETYYTFGPAVAGVVGESDTLRQAARDVLAPIVARVRGLAF